MSCCADVLAFFAKLPIAGQVKTRLADKTSPAFAAQVAEAFLRDIVAKFSNFESERFLVFAPSDSASYFAGIAGERFRLEAQGSGDLGDRLAEFIECRYAEGARKVIVLGADSPTLPVEYVMQAAAELERTDVVLGPATDGGYYLLGCTRVLPPIFHGIDWGGPKVLGQTVDRARAAGLRLALLPPWYDVDTHDDWEMLRGHFRAMRLAGVDPGIPFTEALFPHSG